ncbi:hypothetical protein UT300005_04460 [Clostridium sp. CTA-5]
MKKYKKIIRRRLLLSMMRNPIFIIVYGISFYELYTLCKYGRLHNNIIILLVCMLFFLVWIAILIIRIMKKPIIAPQQNIDEYEFYESGIKVLHSEELRINFQDIKSFKVNKKYSFILLKNKEILILNMINKPQNEINIMKNTFLKSGVKCNSFYKVVWNYIAIIIIILITLFYGAKIYESAINYNGKLSWFLNDFQNKKTVNFDHNNIYESGIEGIFTDINKKIHMPKDLYVSNNFSLTFDSNGIITSFDAYLYGKEEKGKLESYLITYDMNKSKNIIINLNGYVNGDYNEDKRIEPLINTTKVIPLKETVSKWNENKYGILYYGKRSFGYNTDGIVYVNQDGDIKQASNASSEIIGYSVSVFVPGKENAYTPVRYIFSEDLNNIKSSDPLKVNESEKISRKSNNGTDEFYLSDKVGYRLEVTGAAAGSRSYSLNGTVDGGVTWNIINEDPFQGGIGVASGITFLNEKLGFLCLSHSGGSNGELYRTEDGGLSYKKVDFQSIKIPLNNGESYNPFDLPEMPYKEDGKLNILIEQGSDGDYNGGCKALYESNDEGKTWVYIKEVNGE